MATTSSPKRSKLIAKLVRPLISAGLIVGGLFQMVEPVFALGTLANTPIDNQATATYSDGTNTINAVSNIVSVTVAPIAGITVVNDQIVDLDGNAVEAGDVVSYYFTVTNTGNYDNVLRVPTEVDLVGLDADGDGLSDTSIDTTDAGLPAGSGIVILFDKDKSGTISLTVDANSNGTWDPGDTGPEVWVYDAGQGDYYNGTTKWDNASELIEPDESFTVVVTALAPEAASGVVAGDPLSVSLGDTTPEDVDGAQNIPYVADAVAPTDNDVYTVNDFNNNGTENDADFVNGQREAAATQTIPYAASVQPLAIAAVKKTGTYTANNVSIYTDDTVTYNLDLEVRDTDPTSLFQPASLAGTDISLNGATANRIIVSDLLPVDADGIRAVLQSTSTSLPAGWQVVYSADDETITGFEAPTTARWFTTLGAIGRPATLADVKRVGFVFNGSLPAGYDTATVTGDLSFTVVLSAATSTDTTLRVYNVAQVVGTTQGDPGNTIYDESGDDNANNFSDDGTPPDPDGSDYDPALDTGSPEDEDEDGSTTLEDDELDTANNNTGTDTDPTTGGGEPNLITAVITVADSILIGPNGSPAAIGPTGTQDSDFTNQSNAFTPADTNNDGIFDDFDPAEIVFTNTIQNPASAGFIADVTVEPADVALVTGTTGAGTLANEDIPNGTVVRITFGGNDAYYVYNNTTGEWSGPFEADLTTPTSPIIVDDQLTPGETKQVTVGINFPSTSGITPLTLPSYPVYLVVFPEDDDLATPGYSNETTYNLTIDRSYPAGFIQLSKSARIYTFDQVTGQLSTIPTDYSDNPDAYASSTGDIRPQDVIEYRIIYTNISEPASGTGNRVLTGNNFILTEDGNAGVNDWYTFTLHQFGTNTGAEATDPPYRGTVTYDGSSTEPANDADVEVYLNTVTTVAPGISGTFTFKREVQ